MKAINYIIFSAFLAIVSCQKVIDVEVDEADENIVIDAAYDAIAEEVVVNLKRSAALFSNEGFEKIENATIEVETASGDVINIPHEGNGIYKYAGLQPEYNSNYIMRVSFDSENFEATAFLPEVVELDSLTQQFEEASLFGDEGYIVFMNLTDPGGERFYRAIRIVNGEKLERLNEQFLFDNEFTQGNFQTVPFFGSRYEPDDTITVQLRSYSEVASKYYSDLFALAGDNGQSAAPANPRTNWNNDALGVFNTYGYSEKTIIIEED